MSVKTKQKAEFGDFQTPDALAQGVCDVVRCLGVIPESIVEPTCGKGSFLRASAATFSKNVPIFGFEINPEYAEAAQAVEQAKVHCEDFFKKDWLATLNSLREPILVIGNPPWVTNSTVGSLGGTNLPNKSNFQRFSGFDAITGKSNFDISEWMLVHLLECLSGRKAVLAMLCKVAIARKVLGYVWNKNLQIARSAIYSIDATRHFDASVDACLLVCILEPVSASKECDIYLDLEASAHDSKFAFRNGRLVSNLQANESYGYLRGKSPLKWRSGVKHDCTRIMELHPKGRDDFENGLGEVVSLEPNYLYPMLKSSELMKPQPTPSRYMLVTQRWVGEDTSRIEREAPWTWDYLQSHAKELDNRMSSIYRNRPRFSVFGIGPYSFAPWKVAISGFYKRIDFRCVGPAGNTPVVLDDTCYFLPCQTEHDAQVLAELLNSEAAKVFFYSFIFWDAKRPITAQLLESLDLGMLAEEAGVSLPVWSDVPQQIALFGS
ncbi:MAG: hypothetical protein M2R45_01943 [Verrucomicrobia subdivision 3 bacterium]|nr:hypothetical protein [Limisphaerales bacterium]MCS1416191.1 hypothetical protein [Limisphaerales bacterium]